MPALAAARRCTAWMHLQMRVLHCVRTHARLESRCRAARSGQVSQSDASRQQSLESSLGAGRRLGSRRQCTRNLKPQEKLAIAPQIERVPLLQARRVDPVFLISPVQAPSRGPLAVVVAAFYVCSQPQPRAISISFGSDSHAAICIIIATCKERLLSSSCMACRVLEKLEA